MWAQVLQAQRAPLIKFVHDKKDFFQFSIGRFNDDEQAAWDAAQDMAHRLTLLRDSCEHFVVLGNACMCLLLQVGKRRLGIRQSEDV